MLAAKPGNEDQGAEACTAVAAVRDDTDDKDDLSTSLLLDETPRGKDRRHPSRRRGRRSTPAGGVRGRDSEDTCGLTSDGSSQDGGDSARRERRTRSLPKGRGRRGVSEGPGRRRASCTQRLHPGREEQSRVREKRCDNLRYGILVGVL